MLSLIFSLLLISGSAEGSDRHVGNGGTGVVCFQSEETAAEIRNSSGRVLDRHIRDVRSVTQVDLYEARRTSRRVQDSENPFNPPDQESAVIPPLPGESAIQYVTRLEQRMRLTVPAVADIISNAITLIRSASVVWHDASVLAANDANFRAHLPDNCVLITLASQVRIGDDLIIHLDRRFFNLDNAVHSALSRHFLALHEGIYRQELDRGRINSEGTRMLLGVIATPNVEAKEVLQVAEDHGFIPTHTLTFPYQKVVECFKGTIFPASAVIDLYERHDIVSIAEEALWLLREYYRLTGAYFGNERLDRGGLFTYQTEEFLHYVKTHPGDQLLLHTVPLLALKIFAYQFNGLTNASGSAEFNRRHGLLQSKLRQLFSEQTLIYSDAYLKHFENQCRAQIFPSASPIRGDFALRLEDYILNQMIPLLSDNGLTSLFSNHPGSLSRFDWNFLIQ